MMKRFKVGDRVSWNSEAGRVSGRIVKMHIKDVDYKGYVHHANKDEPQYEIKSDKTDHVALHNWSMSAASRARAPIRYTIATSFPRGKCCHSFQGRSRRWPSKTRSQS
jgi:hypothetical protein